MSQAKTDNIANDETAKTILFDMEDIIYEADCLADALQDLTGGRSLGVSEETLSFLAGELKSRTTKIQEDWRRVHELMVRDFVEAGK